jgi:hypothetical protein
LPQRRIKYATFQFEGTSHFLWLMDLLIRKRAPVKTHQIDMKVRKTGNIRYIVDSQQFKWQQNRQQAGNRPATFFAR